MCWIVDDHAPSLRRRQSRSNEGGVLGATLRCRQTRSPASAANRDQHASGSATKSTALVVCHHCKQQGRYKRNFSPRARASKIEQKMSEGYCRAFASDFLFQRLRGTCPGVYLFARLENSNLCLSGVRPVSGDTGGTPPSAALVNHSGENAGSRGGADQTL